MTDLWRECSAALLAKAIGELCFEGLLTPTGDHELRFEDAVYTFSATRTAFGGWVVRPGSVRRAASGILGDDVVEPCDDVQQFVVDAFRHLRVDPATTAGFLAEVTATLAADVALASTARPVAELAPLPQAELDGHLTGHPWLIANKGRVGFSADDLARHSPEARTPVRLPWLAVHRGLAEFRGTSALSESSVRAHELDPVTVERFTESLREAGVDPEAYVWLPAHPWQLDHVVRTLWAPELATGRIVELGEAPDWYLPTQAIRTVSNVDSPTRYQVKLPLRVLNTSVYRGIPPHCTLAAPVVTQWLSGLWAADKLLGEWGTDLLGEVASVTVRHPQLSRAGAVPYQWLETMGCIWREPVALRPGERSWSLAALLHVDRAGRPLVLEYLGGTDPAVWFAALLRALLRPLLHVLYTYGVTFNPHGENVVVITDRDHVPVRVALLDLVDDVNVSVDRVPARGLEPDAHDPVLPRKPWPILRQYVVDALLIGVLRPLSTLLPLPEDHFWGQVRGEVDAYRARFPELAARMDEGSLTTPTFLRYPLNSYRITLGYRDLTARPPVPQTDTLPNPLHSAAPIPPPDGW
ncbi:IucA/IucC family protein [Saccharothrix texasensis]|uniref:Siderophore synthetase component n=1 Tax=Saccharothrix texasensis TaxID=103734 RepID=A0A3N1HG06_9PSEU|nr:IucA/IucC family protein [Saccharothrix texasensis]ROP41427.1 siderophore synthetase component [Saccharothrix texasensis]